MDTPGAEIALPARQQRADFRSACPTGSCTDSANTGGDGWTEVSPLRNVAVLQESSKRGCPVCRFLLEVVDEIYPGWTSSDAESKEIKQRDGVALLHHKYNVAEFWLKDLIPGTIYLLLH